MSFRINTNTTAMNALRNLGNTSMESAKSMTRLSTGLRINSASDDPAGLIVSENMRAQISGLDQATRNNQDAVNYAKTAEGAMDEVSKLLRDARSIAVASGNGATLTDSQRQANQQQLSSIVESVNRISSTTSYGSKKLLDGSSGVSAASTSAANISDITITGSFGGSAMSGSSTITVNITTAATRATSAGDTDFKLFTFATDTVSAGSFSVNGVSFSTSASDTVADVVARVNNASDQTGVTAAWTAGGTRVSLTSKDYGSLNSLNVVDSNGVLRTNAGSESYTGVNAAADVSIDTNGAVAGGLTTVSFTSGNGLNLRDTSGNALKLTENGNLASGAAARGQVNVGSAQFQIGANAGETAALSLGNFRASNLGNGAVASKDLSNIDVLSNANSTDALNVIDKAIDQLSSSRGQIGNFIRNTLESNIRSLGVQKENLAATESSIRDVDVADEMTKFTKLQILQQSGMSMLAQANSSPQSVLSLLRG